MKAPWGPLADCPPAPQLEVEGPRAPPVCHHGAHGAFGTGGRGLAAGTVRPHSERKEARPHKTWGGLAVALGAAAPRGQKSHVGQRVKAPPQAGVCDTRPGRGARRSGPSAVASSRVKFQRSPVTAPVVACVWHQRPFPWMEMFSVLIVPAVVQLHACAHTRLIGRLQADFYSL